MTSNYNIAFTNLVALKQKNKTIFLIKMTERHFKKTNPRRKSGGDGGRGLPAGKKAGNESGGVVNKFTPFQQAEHPVGAGPAYLGELLFLQAQG